MTKTLAASLAALTLLLSAGTALAASGHATQHVNVRAGAGSGYAIVGSLSAGEEVDIVGCGDGWCEIDEGYVSAAYLSIDGDDDEAEDDEGYSFIDEDGEFDDDPLDLEDSVPESIHSGFGDDD